MHVLVVALSFPSPDNPSRSPFIKEQVLQMAKRVERITVLCPTTAVPFFGRWVKRGKRLAQIPEQYSLVEGKCEVWFPKVVKAPGDWLLSWTKVQWCRLLEKTILELEKTHPITLIHAHSGSVSAWASLWAARRHCIPLVVTYHGSEVHSGLVNRTKGWRMCRDVFRHAQLNLPVSHDLENILRGHMEPHGKCETLILGVDQSRFFPSCEPYQGRNILFVGRITKEKGVFDLLLAFIQVKKRFPDAVLTVVGNDGTGGKFVKRMTTLGLGNSVKLVGPLSNQQIPELMRNASLFCLPSYGEGTPVSVMEAMACGLPIVATPVGGIPAIVCHNQTGLLVERGDVQGISQSIELLLENPDERVRLGRAAREFACEHFDGEKTADRLHSLYQELLVDFGKNNRL